jgi:C4-dicarboxylate transporter DctM subunit
LSTDNDPRAGLTNSFDTTARQIATRATGLARALAALAGAVIAALGVLVNADIISRSVLDQPLRGVSEIIAISMPVTVFLVLAWSSVSGGLIRAGLLRRWFDPRSHRVGMILEVAFGLIGTLLSGAIATATWPWLQRAWNDGEFLGVEGEFTVMLWPARLAIFIGSGLLTIFSAGATWRAITVLWRRRPLDCLWPCLLLTALPLLFLGIETRAGFGALSIVLMFLLLYAGLPVAFALLGSAALGIGFIKGSVTIAANSLGLAAGSAVSSYVFGAVPLFVLMGLVMGRADLGRDALQAAHWLLRGVKGGLGVATVAANAVFAAITGISIASAAIFSKVAVPPLIEQGFTARFAVGLVAGTSVLGMLIPPSLLLIIYGVVAEVSINALFLAAIVPGLLLSILFAALVVVVSWLKPAFAIRGDLGVVPAMALDARSALRKMLPIVLLIGAVLGGIYAGLFTPTEAGAVGAALAASLALVMRRLRPAELGTLLFDSATTSASILFLIVAASAFGMMLTLSGIPNAVGDLVAQAGFGLTGYTLIYLGLLIMLGMVLDSTSILLIMVPLALPTVKVLGGDPIWFGIVTAIGVEIGLLTPPLGLSVFAIKSSLDDQTISLNDIFIGAVPFAILMLALTVLLILVPTLARVFV